MANFGELVGTAVNSRSTYADAPPQIAANPDWAKVAASARCWAQSGDAFFPVSEVVEKLPAGAYRCMVSNQGPYLEKMPIQTDSLLTLPDSAVDALLSEFRQFWTLRKNFDERGFTFKRGLLMWGPPGSGKTSAIWQMTQELVHRHDGVVVFVESPQLAVECIHILRRIEPNRPMITIMEDLDALVSRHGDHGFLALLDGETQISNVVHIATTNYPEYLDKRFVDRPSRFDTIMHVGMPSAEARRGYLKAKEPSLDETTLERWVRKTDGYSIAHLREVIIAVKCFEQDESSVFQRLSEMQDCSAKSDGLGGQRRQVGFNSLSQKALGR
jgi:hypothetical protein